MQNNQPNAPVSAGRALRDQLKEYSQDRMKRAALPGASKADRKYRYETIEILKQRAEQRKQKSQQQEKAK